MSPIDDELRKAMHARADLVSAAPDPLSGIESKARRIKRRRSAGAVAGAALTVAAVAFAVPSLSAGTSPGRAQVATSASPSPTSVVVATTPGNLLDWQARGDAPSPGTTGVMETSFAQAMSTNVDEVHVKVLYSGTHKGLTVTVGQAWHNGELAYNIGYATGGASGPELFVGKQTALHAPVVAFLAAGAAGTATDLLVLASQPGTGLVSYSPDATTRFKDVASGRSDVNFVGLVDRDRRATNDRVEILDGDGNMDKPLYRGPVAPLVCGNKECG